MRPAWKKFTRRWATLAILGTAPLSTAALAEEPGLPKTRFSQAAEASFKEDDEFASLQPTPANQAPTLPETQVIAEPTAPQQPPVFNNPDPLNLPPSVLNGSVFAAQPVQGYNADSSNVGSIVNIPTLQFPGTVSTVTSDMRRDQQALRINDVLRDIGGAVFTGSPEQASPGEANHGGGEQGSGQVQRWTSKAHGFRHLR